MSSKDSSFVTGYTYLPFLERDSICGTLADCYDGGPRDVARRDDGVSSEIAIEEGVPFGGNVLYKAYVSFVFIIPGVHEPPKAAKERTSPFYRKINRAVAGTKNFQIWYLPRGRNVYYVNCNVNMGGAVYV